MPKQVDHQARRQEIAAAVRRLVSSQGLDGVSLRHVAAEAGVSMGRVQHYFATKDELLLFAFQTIGERAERRLAAAMGEAGPNPRARLRALLVEMLLLSDEGRAEAPVLAAFLARAVVEPALAASLHQDSQRLTEFVAEHIRAAQRDGTAVADLDPGQQAVTLLALADGLMLHLLLGQVDGETALAAVDAQLARVFGAARAGDSPAHQPRTPADPEPGP